MTLFAAVVWVAVTGGPWASAPAPAPTGPRAISPSAAELVPPADVARVGFIGLPPEGAEPSTPETGELVLAFSAWPTPTGYLHRAWVYADGRLVWLRHGDLPEGASPHLSGLLEQRLTPEGVERLRSEVVSVGLVEGGRSRAGDAWLASYVDVRVRIDGRLVRIAPGGEVGGLVARFLDPASWLPADAWADREIRAYVPSRYAVCSEGPSGAGEPRLPATAVPAPIAGSRCASVTTREARALAEALDRAGFERDGADAHRLTYRPDGLGASTAIWFEPYLPHGEPFDPMGGGPRA